IRYNKKDKNEAKMDKSEHEIGRVQEIEAKGAYIFKWVNPYPFNGLGLKAMDKGFVTNEGIGLMEWDAPMLLDPSLARYK
ncbi:hypothetical protein Tco_0568743, partial [Tanacetum coccineum]